MKSPTCRRQKNRRNGCRNHALQDCRETCPWRCPKVAWCVRPKQRRPELSRRAKLPGLIHRCRVQADNEVAVPCERPKGGFLVLPPRLRFWNREQKPFSLPSLGAVAGVPSGRPGPIG